MNFSFLFLAGVLNLTPSVKQKTPYTIGYRPAIRLRSTVESSIKITNTLLSNSGEKIRLIAEWKNTPESNDIKYIKVFLVKSNVKPKRLRSSYEKSRDIVARQLNNKFELNEEFKHCLDTDDCVEKMYSINTSNLVISTLSNISNTEIAINERKCKCIVLFESDLLRFEIVFGENWDSFILSILYDSVSELEKALEDDKVPNIFLDLQGAKLSTLIPIFLLHEAGHYQSKFKTPDFNWKKKLHLEKFESTLNSYKKEEIRADSYATYIYKKGCFNQPELNEDIRETCINSGSISMLLFVLSLTGKSKDAICLRYLDTSIKYPNIILRYLLKDRHLSPKSEKSYNKLVEYLETRENISKKPWAKDLDSCKKLVENTFTE